MQNRRPVSSQPAIDRRLTFICWGELLWDLFPTGPELGGSAANVAINLHRLGARPLLVSRVGRDALGDAALQRLNTYGLDTSHVQRDGAAPTGTVDVTIVDREPLYAIATESAWDWIEFEEGLHALLHDVHGIVYGTLAQRTPIVQDALRQLLESRPASCWTVCDLNLRPPHIGRSLVQDALAFADVVKMNETELQRVSEVLDTQEPIQSMFESCGVRIIAVTRRERGCTIYTRTERFDHDGYPLLDTGGDSVGAGDAFTATLAYELVLGTRPNLIAQKANDHARRVASARGAFGFVNR